MNCEDSLQANTSEMRNSRNAAASKRDSGRWDFRRGIGRPLACFSHGFTCCTMRESEPLLATRSLSAARG